MRCLFFFGLDKCLSVQLFEKSKSRRRFKKIFDKKFIIISENKWRSKDSTFQIYMLKPMEERLFITYERGFSNY